MRGVSGINDHAAFQIAKISRKDQGPSKSGKLAVIQTVKKSRNRDFRKAMGRTKAKQRDRKKADGLLSRRYEGRMD